MESKLPPHLYKMPSTARRSARLLPNISPSSSRATETLLDELQTQEAALKALDRRMADLDDRRVVPIDGARLASRVAAVAAHCWATIKQGGPQARRLLQCVLKGRRVPCAPFREPGRRGYRFCEEKIRTPDCSPILVAPTGFEPVF
jgi:hypothetical protein